jgi:hypothetical protein
MQNELRALTLWRPWPHAIFFGGKHIENRPWKPWERIIGHYIALHAGLKYDNDAAADMRELKLYDPPEDIWCPKGAIVGVARVVGYVESKEGLFFDSVGPKYDPAQNPWFSGPFAWKFDGIVPFIAPVKAKGSQGLWIVDGELKRQVRDAHLVGLGALRNGKTEADYRAAQGPESY